MSSYLISGGRPLSGQLHVHGSKNAALPIIAASLLHQGVTVIRGCPDILDVKYMVRILRSIGCEVVHQGDMLRIDASEIHLENLSRECIGKMRSSILLLGAVLGRCHHMVLDYPGGCTIGARPVDIHLRALEQMGVHIEEQDREIYCETDGLSGARIVLPYPSVGESDDGRSNGRGNYMDTKCGEGTGSDRPCRFSGGDGCKYLRRRNGQNRHFGQMSVAGH